VEVKGFDMLATEVTEDQFLRVMGHMPSCGYGGESGADTPVECVTWYKARQFCECVGGRLPSETEWEYAAQGGIDSYFHSGAGPGDLDAIAWWDGNSGKHKHDVAEKEPNPFGLYDMLGNVWEWTQDCWQQAEAAAKAGGTECVGDLRVARGGGFTYYGGDLRIPRPAGAQPAGDAGYGGFRCAR